MACYIPRWYTHPNMVTHPGTNRGRRALTSFMRRTPLTTTPRRQHDSCVFCSYPDVVLATLLCIRSNLCRRRCEIKLNDMVFVGYPMQMPSAASAAASSTHTSPSTCISQTQVFQPSPKREQSSTVSYNIVFAVKVLLLLFKCLIEIRNWHWE